MDSELKLEQSMAAAVAQAATLVGHEDVEEGEDSDIGDDEPSGSELDTAPTSVAGGGDRSHDGNGVELDQGVNGTLDNEVSKVVGDVESSDISKPNQQPAQLQQVQSQSHQVEVDDIGEIELNELPEPFAGKLKEYIQKAEMERFLALTGELAYLRGYLEIVHHKIDKFTTLLLDIASDVKNQDLAHSLQAIAQDLSAYPKETDNEGSNSKKQLLQQQQQQQQQQHLHHHHHLPVSLDSNMDPALHNVAVAAVAQAAAQEQQLDDSMTHSHHHPHHQEEHTQNPHQIPGGLSTDSAAAAALKRLQRPLNDSRKRKKRNDEGNNVDVDDVDEDDEDDADRSGRLGARKPKFNVEFLHNPMSIKEIYDEFTKGFRGQIPLCEMDDKYGKHNWRGDSRSKESKRFQRRKKLCDAIHRGMEKYGKLADEVISYIETFRDNKSLTWIMNGNLPQDLLT
ncbi:uncharacterized protein KQ657_002485 [Scheffersomyces spartinae]|uniref:Transcription activator GCR1-like domain-containing protein n=1 Tax=Scheffersomyces spartinae TaxID=45513 RepID=A0A9P7V6J4_9ASCO|nr:uncharacterized protein KQ657_002485 [Scheffersomyces spartinae]KAG7192120.1 hypothetical protein KQ657_002485 [Scheffersomyces spartinae]